MFWIYLVAYGRWWRMEVRLYTAMRGALYILESLKFLGLYLGYWLVRYPQDFYR